MDAEQVERVREIIQGIATDECISFAEAFAVAIGLLSYHADNMPKGRVASGGSGRHKD